MFKNCWISKDDSVRRICTLHSFPQLEHPLRGAWSKGQPNAIRSDRIFFTHYSRIALFLPLRNLRLHLLHSTIPHASRGYPWRVFGCICIWQSLTMVDEILKYDLWEFSENLFWEGFDTWDSSPRRRKRNFSSQTHDEKLRVVARRSKPNTYAPTWRMTSREG